MISPAKATSGRTELPSSSPCMSTCRRVGGISEQAEKRKGANLNEFDILAEAGRTPIVEYPVQPGAYENPRTRGGTKFSSICARVGWSVDGLLTQKQNDVSRLKGQIACGCD